MIQSHICVIPRNKKYFSRRNWEFMSMQEGLSRVCNLNPILNKQYKKELGEHAKWQYFKFNPLYQ